VALIPGLISLLLATLPGVELTLPSLLFHSALLGTLYCGFSHLWTPTLRPIPSVANFIKLDGILVYSVAVIATVAIMYGLRKTSRLRSGRTFHERPGSVVMVGLLAFAVATFSGFPAAVMLQWFVDHVLRRVDNLAAIFVIHGVWLFVLLWIVSRSEHLQLKEKIAGAAGWLLSFPLVFYLFIVVQFAAKWNF